MVDFGDLSGTFYKEIVKPRCVQWFSQLVFRVYSSSYVGQHFVWCMNWTKQMPRPRNNPMNHAGPAIGESQVCVGRDLQTDSVSQFPHWARLRMSKTQSHVIVNRKLVLTTAD